MPPRKATAYMTEKRRALILEFKEEAMNSYGQPGSTAWMNELHRRLVLKDPTVTMEDLDRWITTTHSWIIQTQDSEADTPPLRRRRLSTPVPSIRTETATLTNPELSGSDGNSANNGARRHSTTEPPAAVNTFTVPPGITVHQLGSPGCITATSTITTVPASGSPRTGWAGGDVTVTPYFPGTSSNTTIVQGPGYVYDAGRNENSGNNGGIGLPSCSGNNSGPRLNVSAGNNSGIGLSHYTPTGTVPGYNTNVDQCESAAETSVNAEDIGGLRLNEIRINNTVNSSQYEHSSNNNASVSSMSAGSHSRLGIHGNNGNGAGSICGTENIATPDRNLSPAMEIQLPSGRVLRSGSFGYNPSSARTSTATSEHSSSSGSNLGYGVSSGSSGGAITSFDACSVTARSSAKIAGYSETGGSCREVTGHEAGSESTTGVDGHVQRSGPGGRNVDDGVNIGFENQTAAYAGSTEAGAYGGISSAGINASVANDGGQRSAGFEGLAGSHAGIGFYGANSSTGYDAVTEGRGRVEDFGNSNARNNVSAGNTVGVSGHSATSGGSFERNSCSSLGSNAGSDGRGGSNSGYGSHAGSAGRSLTAVEHDVSSGQPSVHDASFSFGSHARTGESSACVVGQDGNCIKTASVEHLDQNTAKSLVHEYRSGSDSRIGGQSGNSTGPDGCESNVSVGEEDGTSPGYEGRAGSTDLAGVNARNNAEYRSSAGGTVTAATTGGSSSVKFDHAQRAANTVTAGHSVSQAATRSQENTAGHTAPAGRFGCSSFEDDITEGGRTSAFVSFVPDARLRPKRADVAPPTSTCNSIDVDNAGSRAAAVGQTRSMPSLVDRRIIAGGSAAVGGQRSSGGHHFNTGMNTTMRGQAGNSSASPGVQGNPGSNAALGGRGASGTSTGLTGPNSSSQEASSQDRSTRSNTVAGGYGFNAGGGGDCHVCGHGSAGSNARVGTASATATSSSATTTGNNTRPGASAGVSGPINHWLRFGSTGFAGLAPYYYPPLPPRLGMLRTFPPALLASFSSQTLIDHARSLLECSSRPGQGPNPVRCHCPAHSAEYAARFGPGHTNMADAMPWGRFASNQGQARYPNPNLPNMGYPNSAFNSPIPYPPAQAARMEAAARAQAHALAQQMAATGNGESDRAIHMPWDPPRRRKVYSPPPMRLGTSQPGQLTELNELEKLLRTTIDSPRQGETQVREMGMLDTSESSSAENQVVPEQSEQTAAGDSGTTQGQEAAAPATPQVPATERLHEPVSQASAQATSSSAALAAFGVIQQRYSQIAHSYNMALGHGAQDQAAAEVDGQDPPQEEIDPDDSDYEDDFSSVTDPDAEDDEDESMSDS